MQRDLAVNPPTLSPPPLPQLLQGQGHPRHVLLGLSYSSWPYIPGARSQGALVWFLAALEVKGGRLDRCLVVVFIEGDQEKHKLPGPAPDT